MTYATGYSKLLKFYFQNFKASYLRRTEVPSKAMGEDDSEKGKSVKLFPSSDPPFSHSRISISLFLRDFLFYTEDEGNRLLRNVCNYLHSPHGEIIKSFPSL